MTFAAPITLTGRHATLVPLSYAHCDDLIVAVKDGELWNLWYTIIPTPDKMRGLIEKRLDQQAKGVWLPFAVIDNTTHSAIGVTSYLNIDSDNRRVEIGGTWYRKSAQRSPINTECKLMLLSHAFEKLSCIAVEFRTSFFNHQSRAGIERLGAKLDGILRSHQVMPNGTLRDTCVYSITAAEWPAVKAHLTHQMHKPRA